MSPWEVLGLTREEARDPATVKRAYARMLKLHRPDRDPEGFRRVRDAYELMTTHPAMVAAWLADDAEADDEEDDSDDEGQTTEAAAPTEERPAQTQEEASAGPPPSPEAAPTATDSPAPSPADVAGSPAPLSLERVPAAVDPMTLAIAELAAVCTAPDADDQRCEVEARRVLVLGGDGGPSWRRAVAAVAHHLAERPAVLAVLMPHDAALRALEEDLSQPVDVLLSWWREQRRWRQVAGFAEVVVQRMQAGHTEHALLAAHLALDLAAREPAIARKLVDLAFRELPSHQRRILESVDFRLALGAEMQPWPESLRHRLVDAMDDGDMPEDPQFRRQVAGKLEQLPENNPLRRAAAEGITGLRLRKPRVVRSPKPAGERSGCGNLALWWIIAIVVINALRLCGSGSSTSHSSSHQTPHYQPPVRVQPIPLPPPKPLLESFPSDAERDQLILQVVTRLRGSSRALVASHIRGEQPPIRADNAGYPYLLAAITIDEHLQHADRIAAVQRLSQLSGEPIERLLTQLRAQRLRPNIAAAVDRAWRDHVARVQQERRVPEASPAERFVEAPRIVLGDTPLITVGPPVPVTPAPIEQGQAPTPALEEAAHPVPQAVLGVELEAREEPVK